MFLVSWTRTALCLSHISLDLCLPLTSMSLGKIRNWSDLCPLVPSSHPVLPSCTLIPVVRAADNDPQLHPSLENCPWPMGAPLPGEAWQVSSPTLKWPMTSQRSQKLGPFAPRANNSVVQFMLLSLTHEIQAMGLETTSLFCALPFSSLLLVLLQVSSESTPWITYVQPGSGSASKETKRMLS